MKKPQRLSRRALFYGLTVFGVLLICVGAVLLVSLRDSGETVTTFSMGSYVQQTVYGGNAIENAGLAANAVAQLDDLISWRKEGGDVSELNRLAGTDFTGVDPRTEQVLTTSLSVCEASGGAFDITIAPISRLWDFDENPHLPDETLLNRFLDKVDYTSLSVLGDGTAALRRVDTALDLGAVGKGAACDAAVAVYRNTGVTRAVVAVGGSIGLYGEKPFHEPWVIAVRDPFSDGMIGTLSLPGGNFVSTSGDYEKCFTENGKTYHHILDPATGYPAESGLSGITVVSDSGTLSDALSTACFVLGLDQGAALLKKFSAEGIFITADKRIFVTQGLRESFQPTASDAAWEILP